ncbi:MAG: LytTR family DNA-binding domain-containing protein [Gemmatimonadales bacterium]|jgi:two-component system LytT family response regulator
MTDPALRVLVVDDEPLARERLRSLLAADPKVELVGECADGRGAVEAIVELAPDLVFLDVQMPLLDGFGVVNEIGVDAMPAVIFVTAYDEYAIQAFEVHALDYLLKPFDRSRFERALERAKEQLVGERGEKLADQLRALLAEAQSTRDAAKATDRLVIRSRGRITFVPLRELDWVEAAGNYARLHAGDETHLMRETMTGLADRLPEGEFVRVSRSAIVRIDRIRKLVRQAHGEYEIVLGDGRRVRSSRGYADRLEELLEG